MENFRNVTFVLIAFVIFCFVSNEDYKFKTGADLVKPESKSAQEWENKYVTNVCAGKWEDTEKLDPDCLHVFEVLYALKPYEEK